MFSNPLLPAGADPWVCQHDGFFYYTQTTAKNITLWKTRDLTGVGSGQEKIVWRPKAGTDYSKNLWAPELHRIGGVWYIYFAADDGCNRHHRLYVLENRASDPLQGTWSFKGQLRTPGDRWAIDGTVFEAAGSMYLLWSGWDGLENGRQDIYIAKLRDPITVEGERVRISTPEFGWERHGRIPRPGPDDKPQVDVNEGPAALIRNGRVFVTYSASGCWTDFYSLGMLWAEAGSNLLNRTSWHKSATPVFTAVGTGLAGTWSTGHNCFFRSPDGTEDWILYHANGKSGRGCRGRSPRAQRFTWNADGFPVFGEPAEMNKWIPRPSGSPDRRPFAPAPPEADAGLQGFQAI